MAKLNFQQPLLQSLVLRSFRNHMLICCSRNIYYQESLVN